MKEWLLNPQITWLRENEIQSKEFINLIEDNDLLELSELDRYKLIKHRLEHSDITRINNIKDNIITGKRLILVRVFSLQKALD